MENQNYKNKNTERKFLNIMQKNNNNFKRLKIAF